MAKLDIFEREGLNDHVKAQSPVFRTTLEKLLDLPSSVTSAARASSSTTRRASGCCAASWPVRSTRAACTAAPTTAATR
jgi:hypothetical protein